MNPIVLETENEKLSEVVTEKQSQAPKRSYARKDKKALTFASVSELIEANGIKSKPSQTIKAF